MSDEQVVRQVYPDARIRTDIQSFSEAILVCEVIDSTGKRLGVTFKGYNGWEYEKAEADAWADARSKLPIEPVAEPSKPSETFYQALDRKEREGRIERLKNRPDNLHDYQGCANDPKMLACGCVNDCEGHAGQQLRAEPSKPRDERNEYEGIRSFREFMAARAEPSKLEGRAEPMEAEVIRLQEELARLKLRTWTQYKAEEVNALEAENVRLRQVVKEYREISWHGMYCMGRFNPCRLCIKADALLTPKALGDKGEPK